MSDLVKRLRKEGRIEGYVPREIERGIEELERDRAADKARVVELNRQVEMLRSGMRKVLDEYYHETADHLVMDWTLRADQIERALAETEPKEKPLLCEECGLYPADLPSKICPGCAAYKEHTAT